MSEDLNDYWQNLLSRKCELWEKATTQQLSEAEQEELLAEYKSLAEKLIPHQLDELERMKIHFQLMERQGTITPDFKALYKKKAELDRKFSDP